MSCNPTIEEHGWLNHRVRTPDYRYGKFIGMSIGRNVVDVQIEGGGVEQFAWCSLTTVQDEPRLPYDDVAPSTWAPAPSLWQRVKRWWMDQGGLVMDDKEYVKGTVVLQPDALPVKPVVDPATFAEASTSLVDSDPTLMRNKAEAWDALTKVFVGNGGIHEPATESLIKGLCRRFGLESPF